MADYTRLSAGRSGFDSPCRGHIMSLEIWNHIKLEIDKARPVKDVVIPKALYDDLRNTLPTEEAPHGWTPPKSVTVKPSKHLPKGFYILYPYYSHPIVLMEGESDGTD